MLKIAMVILALFILSVIYCLAKLALYRRDLKNGKAEYCLPIIWRICGWQLQKDVRKREPRKDGMMHIYQHETFEDSHAGTIDVFKPLN